MMFGVLVDVSGSMEMSYALERSRRDANVERVHAIITTIINIVNREVTHYDRPESIFVSAFGLDTKNVNTCDLVALLDLIAGREDLRREKGEDKAWNELADLISGPEDLRCQSGHEALIGLAKRENAPHAEQLIKKYLSESQARDLYKILCFDKSLMSEMSDILPQPDSRDLKKLKMLPSKWEQKAVHRSEPYKFAEKLLQIRDNIIKRSLHCIEKPEPRPVQYVSELLEYLDLSQFSSRAHSESLHSRIRELIDSIKPYIFGGTPMCKAMYHALTVFKGAEAKSKVLFILSDGMSADGDPRPIAQEFQDLGIQIVTCYLTADRIYNPRCLLDKADPKWPKDGRSVLFEMSSTMRNIDPPVSYLVDAKWELPSSGESRLFIQANSLDVVNEVCETVVSQMNNPCDALVDMLEKVSLATYINQRNAEFEPKKQVESTCYANAVAAVFHLAMQRIIGREGRDTDFYAIRVRLIQEYGKSGANTRKVLEEVCPEYRLHFREVDETHARQALNKRQPVVATFFLSKEEWENFSKFYKKSPKGILQNSDVTGGLNVC